MPTSANEFKHAMATVNLVTVEDSSRNRCRSRSCRRTAPQTTAKIMCAKYDGCSCGDDCQTALVCGCWFNGPIRTTIPSKRRIWAEVRSIIEACPARKAAHCSALMFIWPKLAYEVSSELARHRAACRQTRRLLMAKEYRTTQKRIKQMALVTARRVRDGLAIPLPDGSLTCSKPDWGWRTHRFRWMWTRRRTRTWTRA